MKNDPIFDKAFAAEYIANHSEMIKHWEQSTDVMKRGFAILLNEAANGGVVTNDC